jgi:hypothetical protein
VKFNRRSLIRACEDLLRREDCQVRLATILDEKTTARCEYHWDPEKGVSDMRLTLDPSAGGLIESALHEALHIVLADEIGEVFNRCTEEVIIRALERELWVKGFKGADTKRWRALLNGKLEQ